MADLLNELQHLNSKAWNKRQETAKANPAKPVSVQSTASDPLLLDEVYSVSPSSPLSTILRRSITTGSASNATLPGSWGQQQTEPQLPGGNNSSQPVNSTTATSPALGSSAAVAAYRRQYLGLDCISSGGAGCAAGQDSAKSCLLKSRPAGKLVPDYGPGHRPGHLPRADTDIPQQQQQQYPMLNLAAKSGTGQNLAPARMQPSSCCPPPNAEPLVSMDPDAKSIIASRQAERVLNPEAVINRLVYDSLEPCDRDRNIDWQSLGSRNGSSSSGSSSRTTRTSTSERTSQSDPSAQAEGLIPSAADGCQYSPGLSSWYLPQGADDPTLVFESRFESGNLRRAVQVYPYEYDLVLQPDINTRGHTQWYYFAVANTRAGVPYRFNVINLLKEDSLYNMGMLPLMHSEQQMRLKNIGWFRTGSEVYYGPNSIKKGKQLYYTLTFTVEFPHDNDWVHLAHCYPYTYTDLQQHLSVICKEPIPDFVIERACLATSLAGNVVDVLTITAIPTEGKPLAQRRGVVLSARVHPGETNASWMMKGALHQLLANTAESKQLREQFVFKVVPMLNPDGVTVGNYRCSLAGLDLNRVWQDPDPRIQPVIRAHKNMIQTFTTEREVVLFCDMHGHSRKYGVFIYGCEKKPGKDDRPQFSGWPVPGSVGGLPGVPLKCQPNMFPLMLYLNAPDLFSYRSCNFKVQKSKSGTGRVVGFRELGLANAFTMEASFCGAAVGKYAKQHFNTGHLEDMGAALVRTLLDYWAPAETNSAADLAAQLTGSAAAGSTAPSQALGLLLDLNAGADEDDVCTDSDDESSEDDVSTMPGQGPSSSKAVPRASKLGADTAVDREPDAAAAAASAAAAISDNVAQIGNQLVAMLARAGGPGGETYAGSAAVAGQNVAGTTGNAASGGAASGGSAVSVLLSALKQQQAATVSNSSAAPDKGPLAGGIAVGRSTSDSRSQSNRDLTGLTQQQQSQQPGGGILTSTTAAMAAANAAQKLLDKITIAKARKQDPASLATTATAEAARLQCSSSQANGPPAAAAPVVAAARLAGAADAAIAVLPSGLGSAGSSGQLALQGSTLPLPAAVGSSRQQPQQLTQEEAVLIGTPGFVDLLQQLVDEEAALTAAVAAAATAAKGGAASAPSKGGKKKGRRKHLAKYGNPEVLRAARARADATLAAALPALGIYDDADPAEPGKAADEDGSNSSAAFDAVPRSAQPSEGFDASIGWSNAVKLVTSGRRANASAGSTCKASMLDAERYMTLLDNQKRHTGGVLASSSIDDPWDGPQDMRSKSAAFARGGWLLPSGSNDSTTTRSSSYISLQQATAASSIPSATSEGPATAEAPAWGDVAGANGATGFGLRRRSKSMLPCMQNRGMRERVESAVQSDALAAHGMFAGASSGTSGCRVGTSSAMAK